jgi:hypothetical protein
MQQFESDDYERPIASYPGYLGCQFEGSFMPERELEPLARFDFKHYCKLVDERGERSLQVVLPSGKVNIAFDGGGGFPAILDQLPTVKVCVDNGPPNAGPASGGCIVYFIAEGVSESELESSILSLVKAMESDLASLEKSE